MKILTFIAGFTIAVLGALGVFMPELLLGLSSRLATPVGLYVAAGIRIGLAILLFSVAGRSRSPIALRIIGGFTFLAGLVTPLVGAERAREYVEWWSMRGTVILRFGAMIALLLGAFIAWAVLRPHQDLRLRPAHR